MTECPNGSKRLVALPSYRQSGDGTHVHHTYGSSSNDPALQDAMPVGLGIGDGAEGCISVSRPHQAEWQGAPRRLQAYP